MDKCFCHFNGYEVKDAKARNNIDKISKNSKYMCYIYCDNAWRQSINYVTEALTRYSEAGFKEAQMLISINEDGTIVEDETKFSQYNEIANNLNIPITSIKFHGKYTYKNYMNKVIEMIGYFPNIKTVFIFNEQADVVYNNALSYPALIKSHYPNVEKVGFTMSYGQAFYSNDISGDMWQELMDNFDLIGVHMYPSCSSYNDASNCNYDKVIEAFNRYQFIGQWTKEIWITESGVLPYWQMMEFPENYLKSKLTDDEFNTLPQVMFYNALDNCNMSKRVTKIIPWFLESGMSDENHEMFNILRKIIIGR